MEVSCDSTSPASSMSPVSSPREKWPPPVCLDLYGRRRQLAKLHVLEREIGMLEDELKSLEGHQLASRCCKELDDFIGDRLDPLIDKGQKTSRSDYFWKTLWVKFSSRFSRMFCLHKCYPCLQGAICCVCCSSGKCQDPGCSCSCMENTSHPARCNYADLACLHTCSYKSFIPKCIKVKLCRECAKSCCNPCCVY